ncbi:MAG: mannosyltransferase B-like protein [uncultured bacterium]|nr:MAG: mannosyltransferase B-like protein [uncultured bacterium]HBR71299.1 hypothetical protein [Candidatus Moranbacteria bacterium]
MKIGIDIRLIGKQRTGDEVVFFNITKKLAEIDSNNEYLLFTDIVDKDIINQIKRDLEISEKNNFQIISISTKNRFSWNFFALAHYLRKNPVDIYLTQYIVPFFVPRKIKIITIIHDISFNFFSKMIKFSDLFFLKILIPISLFRTDKILGVSKFTRDEIIKFYKINPDKVDFFHNAVSENFKNKYSKEELERIRNKYSLPKKFILYLGTLQPRKNLPFLIKSYAKIRNDLAGTKLVLAGNKNAHNTDKNIDIEVEMNNLQQDVIFPGYIDEGDKPVIYALAHIFVFPSLYEGFGIPILEAFCSQTPVLASDIPSLREVGGDAAFFANPSSLDEFSKALYDISINNDLRNRLISSGNKRAELFSWEKTAKKLIDIFNCIKSNN